MRKFFSFLAILFFCSVISSAAMAEDPHSDSVAQGMAFANNDALLRLTSEVRTAKAGNTALVGKINRAKRQAVAEAKAGDVEVQAGVDKNVTDLDQTRKDLDQVKEEVERFAGSQCSAYEDVEVQKLCLNVQKAKTAEGEKSALETFKAVARPVPKKRVEQTEGEQKTVSEEFSGAGAGSVPYTRMVRYTGGDTPVYTEFTSGQRKPIPLPKFITDEEEESRGISPWVQWGVIPVASMLIGGALAGMISPEGPVGDSFSYGSDGKGMAAGAGVGLGIGAIIEAAK